MKSNMLSKEEVAYRTAISSFAIQFKQWSKEKYKSKDPFDYGRAMAYEEVAENLEFFLNDNIRGILNSE